MSEDRALQRLILAQRVENERRQLKRALHGVRQGVGHGTVLRRQLRARPHLVLAAGFVFGLMVGLGRR